MYPSPFLSASADVEAFSFAAVNCIQCTQPTMKSQAQLILACSGTASTPVMCFPVLDSRGGFLEISIPKTLLPKCPFPSLREVRQFPSLSLFLATFSS